MLPVLLATLLAAAPSLQKCPDGPCRKLKSDEREAMGERLLLLSRLLPLPQGAWTLTEKRCTAPDVAECDLMKGPPQTPGALCSWFGLAVPDGVFPLKSGVLLRAGAKDAADVVVRGELLGTPAAPAEGAKVTRRNGLVLVERRDAFGATDVEIIAGATGKGERPLTGPASDALAPVRSVRVTLHGPAAAVEPLARRIDAAGLKALLGPVVAKR